MKLWRYGQSVEYLGRRYRLDGMLGSGGMADVCLGWDEREQREVALKILKSDDLDQETLNRFMKEAAQIAHWQHPHILRIYESLQVELIDAANGSVLFYMVSEYARGGDLQKRLTPGRPFPLSATFALFRQLCDAVQYAHERGVIHRDLKPLNMLFRRPESGPEEVVLSDFGLAVQIEASHYTFAHGGTLAYMAPEQFQGRALPASDIFALGVILYLLCTGGLPFRRTLRDMPRIVQGQTPVPTRPSLVNPEVPPLLDEVILRALRELPAERYRQPRDFWEALELALTMSARTLPYVADFWQAAGHTWPYEEATPAQRAEQIGQVQAFAEASQAREDAVPEVEEGPASALWIAREKQKASSVRLPLPTHSILAFPNPDAPGALAQALPHPSPRQSADGQENPDVTRRMGEAGGATRETPPRRAQRQVRAPGASEAALGEGEARTWRDDEEPGRPARPSASLAGSTILPGPRGGTRDEEQTSRGQQPFEPSTYETSQHRHLSNSSTRQSSRRQAFDLSSALNADQAQATSRSSLRRQVPRRQSGVSMSNSPQAPVQRARGAQRSPTWQAPGAPGKVHTLAGTRNRSPRLPLVVLLGGMLVLILGVLGVVAFQRNALTLPGTPAVTVTLQPRAQLLQDTATLNLRTDGGQLAPDEIPGRLLTATSPTQSATANATGATQGKRATGQLTFLNDTANTITIAGGTVTGNSGVKISFAGPITISALNPTFINVSAIAVDPGVIGNIAAFDIDKPCCATGVVVKNASAFTGGQDGQPNSVIQQKDIDGAVGPLAASGQAQARALLQQQIQANERIVGDTQCQQPRISSDQKVGAVAKQATVQVVVTCSESVYNLDAARQFFARDLQNMAQAKPVLGASSAQAGPLTLTLLSASPAPAGNQPGAVLQFRAQGLWAYQFSPAVLHHLASLIVGKSQSAARVLLQQQPGISTVQFNHSGRLPNDANQIQMLVATPSNL